MNRPSVSGLSHDARQVLYRLLSEVRYEILPLADASERAAHLPAGSQIAVTADPEQTMAATVDLSVGLAASGYEVIPHLSALGNDPWPYNSILAPTLVFEDVQFSGA